MEAKSIDKKTFQLTDKGQLLGEIIYENLFLLKATINITDAAAYKIKPVGFFNSSIAVTKDETNIANISLGWNGQIVIALQDGKEYMLKLNNIFSNKYILENKHKESLLQIESKFNWRLFQYTYDISYNVECQDKANDTLLVLLSIYSVNYFIATMSGANAGMM